MNEPDRIPDEWLSAYLDGELLPDELRQVTRALEQDDEARISLDELSQLRDQLRTLPRYTLPSNFADRVVEQCSPSPVKQSTSGVPRRVLLGVLAMAATMLVAILTMRPWEIGTPAQLATSDASVTSTELPALNDAGMATGTMSDGLALPPQQDRESTDTDLELAANGVRGLAEPMEFSPAEPEKKETAAPALPDAARVDFYFTKSQLEQLNQQIAQKDDTQSRAFYWYGVTGATDPNSVVERLPEPLPGPELGQIAVLEGTAAEIAEEIQQVKAESVKLTILQRDLQPEQLGLFSIAGAQVSGTNAQPAAAMSLQPGNAPAGLSEPNKEAQEGRQLAVTATDGADQRGNSAGAAALPARVTQSRAARVLPRAAAPRDLEKSQELTEQPRYRIILVPHTQD